MGVGYGEGLCPFQVKSSVNLYYGSKAISFKGCNLWNQLPEDIKNIKNTTRFKRKLRELFHNCMSLC